MSRGAVVGDEGFLPGDGADGAARFQEPVSREGEADITEVGHWTAWNHVRTATSLMAAVALMLGLGAK